MHKMGLKFSLVFSIVLMTGFSLIYLVDEMNCYPKRGGGIRGGGYSSGGWGQSSGSNTNFGGGWRAPSSGNTGSHIQLPIEILCVHIQTF